MPRQAVRAALTAPIILTRRGKLLSCSYRCPSPLPMRTVLFCVDWKKENSVSNQQSVREVDEVEAGLWNLAPTMRLNYTPSPSRQLSASATQFQTFRLRYLTALFPPPTFGHQPSVARATDIVSAVQPVNVLDSTAASSTWSCTRAANRSQVSRPWSRRRFVVPASLTDQPAFGDVVRIGADQAQRHHLWAIRTGPGNRAQGGPSCSNPKGIWASWLCCRLRARATFMWDTGPYPSSSWSSATFLVLWPRAFRYPIRTSTGMPSAAP